jgi:ABC-type amino acid transport system permease subunit
MSVLDILINYHQAFLNGLWVTMQLCLIIWGAGIVVGGALGLAGSRFPCAVGWPSRIISFILSAIPVLVFLFWLHYPAQAMLDIVVDPFYTAALTLAILNIFSVAGLVRGAITDFPQQYLIAAKVTGLTPQQTIFKIQLPLILREILPGLLLLQVGMLHATLFASLISIEEIFRIAQRINAQIYRPVEIYTALGVFFLIVCLPVNGFAFWLKTRFTRNISEH